MSAISSLCRTCMVNIKDNTDGDVYSFDIFETEGLAKKLMLCSNIEIQPNDEYPPNICNECCVRIFDSMNFRKMCRDTLDKFDKLLENTKSLAICRSSTLDGKKNTNVSEHRQFTISDVDIEEQIETAEYGVVVLSDNQIIVVGMESDVEEDPDSKDSKVSECDIVEKVAESFINGARDPDFDILMKEVMTDDNMIRNTNETEREESVSKDEPTNPRNINCIAEITHPEIDLSKDLIDGAKVNENDPSKVNCVLDLDCKNQILADTETVIRKAGATFTVTFLPPEKSSEVQLLAESKQCTNNENRSNIEDRKDKETNKLFFCDICSGRFYDKHHLIAHKRQQKCSLLYPCSVKNCTRVYNTLEKLRGHLKEHEKTSEVQLSAESKQCTNNGNRSNIEDRKDKETNKLFFCDICLERFYDKHRLIAHKRQQKCSLLYKCSVENCTSIYKTLDELRGHLKEHEKSSEVQLSAESKQCTNNENRSNIEDRKDKETNKLVFCSICGLVCFTTCNLQIHLRRFHKQGAPVSVSEIRNVDEALWPYRCDCEGCSKSFQTEVSYKKHKNRHNGRFIIGPAQKAPCAESTQAEEEVKQKFHCETCNRIFSSYFTLRHHIMKHTGEKPYRCDTCGVKFRFKRYKVQHEKESMCGKSRNMIKLDTESDEMIEIAE